jgi:hypothetical protein
MKYFIVMVILLISLSGWWYWSLTDNFDMRMVVTPKTLGKGEYTTIQGKLRKNIFGKYTIGGNVFELNDRVYWSCIDKSKIGNEIVNMGDFVNSFKYYQRLSQDLDPLKLLLKSKMLGQVTGELNKEKHLFTTTKAVIVYDCPKE